MFDLSPEKILVIMILAVMVLGPDRLPKAARTFGKILHQVRSTSGSLQSEMRDVLAEPRRAINDAVGDLGIPTDLSLPRVPTARSLVTQVLSPPPVTATSRDLDDSRVQTSGVEASSVAASGVEASGARTASVEATSLGALPDDPSLN